MGNTKKTKTGNNIVEKLIVDEAKGRNYYNKSILDNESIIDIYVCENGDELRFGKGLSDNVPFYFLRRFYGENCKGAVLLDKNSIWGISKAIDDSFVGNISAKTQLDLNITKIEGVKVTLSAVQIGLTSRVTFLAKNLADDFVFIELENIKINEKDYPGSFKSGWVLCSKKNKEIGIDIETKTEMVTKMKMDVVVHARLSSKQKSQRRSIEVIIDPYTESVKTRIVTKEKEELIPSGDIRDYLFAFPNIKTQQILFKYSSSKNEELNFGKGLIHNEKYFYIKRISEGIVEGEVILEGDALKALNRFIYKALFSDAKPLPKDSTMAEDKKFEGLEVMNRNGFLVRLCNVRLGNKTKLYFKVRNRNQGNAIIELDNITVDGNYYFKTLKSGLISSSKKQKRDVIFEIDKINHKNCRFKMRVVAKASKCGIVRTEKQGMELFVGTNGLVEAKICDIVDTVGTSVMADGNNSKAPEKKKEKSSNRPISLIEFRYFFVYTSNISCKKLGHKLEKETAVIGVGQHKAGNPYIQQYEIPVCKCSKCKAYYISESLYRELETKGRFLPKLFSQTEFNNKKFEGTEGSEHIMHKFGYSVKANGLGSKGRHKLLEQLIESGIVTEKEAVGHIRGLISRNRFRKNMNKAIEKWEEDIEYLTGQRLKIGVKGVVISEEIKKFKPDKYPI